MNNNRAAFDRWAIVPRMTHGIRGRDLTTDLLGTAMPAPMLLAPIGAGLLMDKDCDLKTARAAAATGVPYVISNQGCDPMEQCAAAMGYAPRWFQLYWSTDDSVVDSLITRAENIGAFALIVTLDTTCLGWRPQDLNLGSLPFTQGVGIAQYTSDAAFARLTSQHRDQVSDGKTAASLGALRTLLSITRNHPGRFLAYSNPGLSWDHLATLRDRTRLPIVLKGILHPDDAHRAFEMGVEGIVVSNHGGRQIDNAVASLDALIRIRDEVGREPTVLLDSGIRTGADVFTALALGADAVLLGRPYMYGLAIAGQRGVEDVIANIIAELDLTMALTGAASIGDITRDFLDGGDW